MSVLLPLYVYPSAGAWDPLYNAAKAHSDVGFTVIVNPCSGPCIGSLPDQVYLDEIPKLKTYENIRTLGYVATNYTTKSLNEVLSEIDQYAKWATLTNNTKLRMDGIFFDETPSTFDPSKFAYLKTAGEAVKNGSRFRDRFVVHNPGLIPTSILTSTSFLSQSYMNLSDITVVFEETFDKWIEKNTFDALQNSQARKSKSAVILHSLPTVSKTVVDWVVEQIGGAADWIFLTNVKTKDEYYHNFSGLFNDLVKAMD